MAYNPDIIIPIINLAFAAVIIFYFIRIFFLPRQLVYIRPWQMIFIAFLVWIIEESLTLVLELRAISYPLAVNRFFELVIIILFLQALWLHKKYIDENISLAR